MNAPTNTPRMRSDPRTNRSRGRLLALGALALLAVAGSCATRTPPPPSEAAAVPAAAEPPEENRFAREVLTAGLDEPMQMEMDGRGRVYVIERHGRLRRFDQASRQLTLLGEIPVFLEGEGGLLGILLDREFEHTRNLYLYYTAAGERREARLSRFPLDEEGQLLPASEIVLLRWSHDVASHMGGGMAWDREGNLYLAVGENSVPTQYSPIVWKEEGGRREDSQRTAANTDDLRGKILRIRPLPDGSYTIPSGNLFAPGTTATRPEIYVMGTRNPWRLSVDSETGYLHWGEIGPDAGRDSAGIGPMGYDELNVATRAGNFGWPHFIGYDRPYHRHDPRTGTYGPPFDPARPVNDSPNNAGLRELPPARPALIAYPYGVSEEFPQLGSGGRAAVGGPVFRRADFGPEAAGVFPAYFEGKWFVVDFVRSWIMTAGMDAERSRGVSLERFLPGEQYHNPIDMEFGPDGGLYVLEYGGSRGGRLSKIEYNPGNRAPEARFAVAPWAGAVPLQVRLSAEPSVDFDRDSLRHEWVVSRREGGFNERSTAPTLSLALPRPGVYDVELTVTDPVGAEGHARAEIVAGNEPPAVEIELTRGNRTFYFPGPEVEYRVEASDPEDGSLASGGIAPDEVPVTVEYLPSGISRDELARVHDLDPSTPMRNRQALQIMAGSDCGACHTVEARGVGPSFREISGRYREREGAVRYLAEKIVRGSQGAWGEIPMPAHPGMGPAEAEALATYVLSLAEADAGPRPIPPNGRVTTAGRTPTGARAPERGAYLFRAAYTDRGSVGAPPLSATDALLLRYPLLPPEAAEVISEGTSHAPSTGDPMFIVDRSGAYLGFRGVDLTGVDRIEIGGLTRFWTWSHFIGASVEVRRGSPEGPLLAPPVAIVPPPEARDAAADEIFLGDRLQPPTPVDVSGIGGVHDLYFVFRNPEAEEDDALLILTGFRFVPTPQATEGAR